MNKMYTDKGMLKEISPYIAKVFSNTNEWLNLRTPIIDILNDGKVDMQDSLKYCLRANLAKPDLQNSVYIDNANNGDEMEFHALLRGTNDNKSAENHFYIGPFCFTFADNDVECSGAATWRGQDISYMLNFEVWQDKLVSITYNDDLVKSNIAKFNEKFNK